MWQPMAGATSRAFTNGNTTTIYDSGGRVIVRETRTGNAATIYDSAGRNVGRYTTNPSTIHE